jgi:hypothetical protein
MVNTFDRRRKFSRTFLFVGDGRITSGGTKWLPEGLGTKARITNGELRLLIQSNLVIEDLI